MSRSSDFKFIPRLWLLDNFPSYLNVWLFKTGHASGYGKYCSFQKIPSGVTLRILSKGKWLIKTNGLSVSAFRGDIFRTVPAEVIEFSQTLEAAWEWYEIQFNGPAAEKFTTEFGLSKSKPVITPDNIPKAISIFKQLHEIIESEKRSTALLLSKLFELIYICGKAAPCPEIKSSSRKKLVEKAVEYIENIPFSNKNISQLSEELGVDRTTLYRAFKEEKGISPHAFFDRFRMSKAIEFLGSDMPVSLVAKRTGFPDVKYFTGWFKSKKGLPPGAWRNQGK